MMIEAMNAEQLWLTFEERPTTIQAVYVTVDNVDRLAAYYARGGYEVTTHRTTTDDDAVTVTLVRDNQATTFTTDQVLVYGNPPTVVADPGPFRRAWRLQEVRDD
jgi:hypothetical protein